MAPFTPQYSQDVTQQFKPEKLAVGWPWRLFLVSVLLLMISVISYLGLKFGYETVLNARLRNIDQSLKTLNNKISQNQEEDFILFYSRLVNLDTMLVKHVLTYKVFSLLEQHTHSRVYYSSMDFKAPERQLILEGLAGSYGVLSEQLGVFEKATEVARYALNQSQLADGVVQFKMTLTLTPETLK